MYEYCRRCGCRDGWCGMEFRGCLVSGCEMGNSWTVQLRSRNLSRIWGVRVGGFLSEVCSPQGPPLALLAPLLSPGPCSTSSLTPSAHSSAASNIDNVVLDEDRSGARRLQNLWR